MMRARILAAAFLAAIAYPMAACGGNDPAPKAAPSATQPVVQPLPSGVTPATELPTSVANVAELRRNITVSTCAKTDKGWQASGTAANPTDKATTYTVTIFFTTTGATVIDWAQATVDVKAGGTAEWTAEKDFTTGPQLTCVLRGVGDTLRGGA